VPIFKAYLGFKAVRLGPGRSEVVFEFWDGARSVASWFIAGFGALAGGCLLLAVFVNLLVEPTPGKEDRP